MEDDDSTVAEMLEFVHEMGRGLYLGDNYYEWDKIKHLWEDKTLDLEPVAGTCRKC